MSSLNPVNGAGSSGFITSAWNHVRTNKVTQIFLVTLGLLALGAPIETALIVAAVVVFLPSIGRYLLALEILKLLSNLFTRSHSPRIRNASHSHSGSYAQPNPPRSPSYIGGGGGGWGDYKSNNNSHMETKSNSSAFSLGGASPQPPRFAAGNGAYSGGSNGFSSNRVNVGSGAFS